MELPRAKHYKDRNPADPRDSSRVTQRTRPEVSSTVPRNSCSALMYSGPHSSCAEFSSTTPRTDLKVCRYLSASSADNSAPGFAPRRTRRGLQLPAGRPTRALLLNRAVHRPARASGANYEASANRVATGTRNAGSRGAPSSDSCAPYRIAPARVWTVMVWPSGSTTQIDWVPARK